MQLTGVLHAGFLRASHTSCCLRAAKQRPKSAGGVACAATGTSVAGTPGAAALLAPV